MKSENKEIIVQNGIKNNDIKTNTKTQKRSEMEKELNIQRGSHRYSRFKQNMSDMEINHLNYYNEIAKQHPPSSMNNPTLKDIVRVTSDESCLNQLKEIEKSKELINLLDNLPLMRVKRINYKNIEIGNMRKSLHSHYPEINEEKGKQFASNVFVKRLKQGGKYTPMTSIDDLYNNLNKEKKEHKENNKKSETFKKVNNNEIWTKKYRINRDIIKSMNLTRSENKNENEKNDINNDDNNISQNYNQNIKNKNSNSTMNESRSFVFRKRKNISIENENDIDSNSKIRHRYVESTDLSNDNKAINTPEKDEGIKIKVNTRLGNNYENNKNQTLENEPTDSYNKIKIRYRMKKNLE